MNVLTQVEAATAAYISAEDKHRPECRKCNHGMWLVGRDKRLTKTTTVEHRTYLCKICGIAQDVTV